MDLIHTIKELAGIVASTVLGFLALVIIFPLLTPILATFWVFSSLTFLVLKTRFNDIYKAHSLDILNGKESVNSKPYVCIITRFTGTNPDVNLARSRFQTNVLGVLDKNGNSTFRKFTQILRIKHGYHYFEDAKDFKAENHIRLIDFKDVGKEKHESESTNVEITPELERLTDDKNELPTIDDDTELPWEMVVERIVGAYGAKQMPEGRPKWEVLLFPEGDKRFTLLMRMHHSLMDGVSFIRLIIECLSDHPFELPVPNINFNPSRLQRCFMYFISLCNLPHKLIKMNWNKDKNCLHGPPLVGKKLFILSKKFSLDRLRRIKRVANTSINEILFSCVSKAIAKHFQSRMALSPSVTSLLAISQHNLKLPLKAENNFAVNFVRLPTLSDSEVKFLFKEGKIKLKNRSINSEKYPSLSRLTCVRNRLQGIRKDTAMFAIQWLMKCAASLLPSTMSDFILSTEGTTIDISNMQGPKSANLVICDSTATDIAFFLPDREPLGIAVAILSFNEMLRVGLTVDKALMNEEEGRYFLHHFMEEIQNLVTEADRLETTPTPTPAHNNNNNSNNNNLENTKRVLTMC